MRTFMIIAAAAGALFATQAAAASIAQDQPTRAVSFRGVDFNSQKAVDGFYARLRNSAREVCNSNAPYDTGAAGRDRACVERVVNEAISQMQRPLLTARHDNGARTGYATGF